MSLPRILFKPEDIADMRIAATSTRDHWKYAKAVRSRIIVKLAEMLLDVLEYTAWLQDQAGKP